MATYDIVWTAVVLAIVLTLTAGLISWGLAEEKAAWRGIAWLLVIVLVPFLGPIAHLVVRSRTRARA